MCTYILVIYLVHTTNSPHVCSKAESVRSSFHSFSQMRVDYSMNEVVMNEYSVQLEHTCSCEFLSNTIRNISARCAAQTSQQQAP